MKVFQHRRVKTARLEKKTQKLLMNFSQILRWQITCFLQIDTNGLENLKIFQHRKVKNSKPVKWCEKYAQISCCFPQISDFLRQSKFSGKFASLPKILVVGQDLKVVRYNNKSAWNPRIFRNNCVDLKEKEKMC